MFQESDDLRKVMKKKDIEFGRHLILKKNQKSCLNNKMFVEYIKSTFIPHVTRIRAAKGIEREEAALLMDVCPTHLISGVRNLLNAARVPVVTFASYTTQIFQLLDLAFFGMLKWEEKYYLPFSDLGKTGNFVYNVYRKMEKTLTAPNIWAVFQAIEITCDTESIPCRIVLHQEKLRESKGALDSGDTATNDRPPISHAARSRTTSSLQFTTENGRSPHTYQFHRLNLKQLHIIISSL
jgi:hypothetical protein